MALHFQPYPVPQEEERNLTRDFVNPLIQTAGIINQTRNANNDQKYRQFQMEMMRAKEAREASEHAYNYGDPAAPDMTTPGGFGQADPRMSLYQPATMAGESQYGNMMGAVAPDPVGPRAASTPSPAEVGAGDMGGGGMVERFRAWQQNRKQGPSMEGDLTNEQLFAPGMGAKRREDFLKTRKSRLEEGEAERKGRETEADIKLKESQAGFYDRRKSGGSGRYTGWTPQSLETRKRNLLSQLRTARLDDREAIMGDIQEIDDIQSQTLASYGGGSAAGGEPGANPRPVLRRRPVPAPAPGGGGAPRFTMGQTAINKQTGQKIQFNGTGWVAVK